jgi:hypothetical protein
MAWQDKMTGETPRKIPNSFSGTSRKIQVNLLESFRKNAEKKETCEEAAKSS